MSETKLHTNLQARHKEIMELVTHGLFQSEPVERAIHIRQMLGKLHESEIIAQAPNDQLIGWYYAACIERMGRKDDLVLRLVITGHLDDSPSAALESIQKNGLVDATGDLIPNVRAHVQWWIARFANSRRELFVA